MRFFLLLIGFGALAHGQMAGRLASALREAGFEPGECYRVRDLSVVREEARFYLTDGYLLFSKPIEGQRVAALFSSEVEGGDGEFLLMPPNKQERESLGAFINSPNLAERIRHALFLFTDGSGESLLQAARAAGVGKSDEMGMLLSQNWNAVLRNMLASFEVRAVQDLLSGAGKDRGFFFAGISGKTLGNFDLMFDPRGAQQITLGQVTFRETASYFDTWTTFTAKSFRGRSVSHDQDFGVADYRIEAALDPTLRMRARTTFTLTPARTGILPIPLDISRLVRVTGARIDGKPAEVFQRESLRASLMRGGANETFLLTAPEPLEARPYRVEIDHEGDVVRTAGNQVYYIESRAHWYPHYGIQFATYDMTFRHPKALTLVATGNRVSETIEGEETVVRFQTPSPVRLAGFNLGDYRKAEAVRGDLRVEVYANRQLEAALQRRTPEIVFQPPLARRDSPLRRISPEMLAPPITPNQGPRLEQLASEVAASFEYMTTLLGPPALPLLTVSPIPGTFGQGFPGLVYLSTLSYLPPQERPLGARNSDLQTFFSDLLHAHETAHQWWGNVVASDAYQDDWMMEALANYMALMFLEKRKGVRARDVVLERFKEHLLAEREGGQTVESVGPLTWGLRLQSSRAPGAWRVITYEKGAWVIHMLRQKLGDRQFGAMMSAVLKRFRFRALTTDQLRTTAAEFVSDKAHDRQLEGFFGQWVLGTGVPRLQAKHSVRGKAGQWKLTGTVTQSGVNDDFLLEVPVEIRFATGKPQIIRVRSGAGPATFAVDLKQRPTRVVLDPENTLLAVK